MAAPGALVFSNAFKKYIADGTVVRQTARGGTNGHSYLVEAEVMLSSGRQLVGSAALPVREGA